MYEVAARAPDVLQCVANDDDKDDRHSGACVVRVSIHTDSIAYFCSQYYGWQEKIPLHCIYEESRTNGKKSQSSH